MSNAPDLEALWTDTYERVRALVEPLASPEVQATVSATPDWDVRQLLSHIVAVDADALADRVPDDLNDEWTAGQVRDRADKSVADLLGEWEQLAPQVQEALRGPEPDASLVVDAWVHEQDMRGALGQPGAREDGAVDVVLEAFSSMGVGSVVGTADGPAPLRMEADGWSTVVGEGEPGGTVRAPSRFELSRALGGRRSAEQVRSWDWDGDPEPYLPHLCPLGPPARARWRSDG